MIQVKCIQKFRDKKDKIIGYKLQDSGGKSKRQKILRRYNHDLKKQSKD